MTVSVACFFLDLKKAFDTVDHRIALNLMSLLNMSSLTLMWYDNYLSGRRQVTKINNVRRQTSDELEIKCGVAQASILGLLIFIFYINDLPDALPGAEHFSTQMILR